MQKENIQPSSQWFIEGVTSSFDLLAVDSVRTARDHKSGSETDKDSLKQDWRNIGKDFQGALKLFSDDEGFTPE